MQKEKEELELFMTRKKDKKRKAAKSTMNLDMTPRKNVKNEQNGENGKNENYDEDHLEPCINLEIPNNPAAAVRQKPRAFKSALQVQNSDLNINETDLQPENGQNSDMTQMISQIAQNNEKI